MTDRLTALRELAQQTDVSDTAWVKGLRKPHLIRMLALANRKARALIAIEESNND